MIRVSFIYVVVGVLGIAAAFTGCGDDGETTAAASSITKPALIKMADRICKNADETQSAELGAYLKANPKAQATEAGQIKMIEAAGLPPLQTEIEEVTALSAPEGDEEEIAAIWDGMKEALKETERDPSSVLTSAGNPFAKVDKMAAKYGFKVCNSAL